MFFWVEQWVRVNIGEFDDSWMNKDEFSTIRRPNRVLTPLKSASKIMISSFVHPSESSFRMGYTSCVQNLRLETDTVGKEPTNRYGEQKIAQFRTHYLTKELAYVSTQQSGQDTMDTKMI